MELVFQKLWGQTQFPWQPFQLGKPAERGSLSLRSILFWCRPDDPLSRVPSAKQKAPLRSSDLYPTTRTRGQAWRPIPCCATEVLMSRLSGSLLQTTPDGSAQTQGREGRGRAPGCQPGSPMLHLKGTQGSAHGGRRAQELPSLVGSPTVPSVCQSGGPDPDLGCCHPGAAHSLCSGLGERKNGSRE